MIHGSTTIITTTLTYNYPYFWGARWYMQALERERLSAKKTSVGW